MGWLKKLIPGSKKEEVKGIGALLPMPAYGRVNPDLLFSTNGNHYGVDWTAQLPQSVMQKIFEYVCPHTMDESYETHNESRGVGCMLCNLKDLSYCVLVCKRWRKFAVPVLYRSIRIDEVHYCPLQDKIEERRTRKGLKDGGAGVERMSLLCRTLRDDTLGLGACILVLKIQEWIPEGCRADLARICAVSPNLRYADLPKGFYSCDSPSMPLRTELENRCPDIRKMSYDRGSEKAFEKLASGQLWINLEVLELTNLAVDAEVLHNVLSVLENLRALKVTNISAFGDELFEPSPHTGFLDFPPVTSLTIHDCPNVSIAGLKSYLSDHTVSTTLEVLDITKTGIRATDIHLLLSRAKALSHFSITQTISDSFPIKDSPPLLQSRSLTLFHYEIAADSSKNIKAKPESYYKYLANSLLQNGFPKLQKLFVRDPTFPELLVNDLAPPKPGFMGDAGPKAPFAGRGTSANRDSMASNFGSSPSRNGFAGLASSPENTQGDFGPYSLSPPRAPGLKQERSHARMSSQNLRQQTAAMPQTGASLAGLAQQGRQQPRQQVPQGLRFPLEVFTKATEEGEWNFSLVRPANPHDPRNRKASASGARPISMVSIEANGSRMSGGFGGGGFENNAGDRHSTLVPNGFGGVVERPDVDKGMKFKKDGPEDEDAAFYRRFASMGGQAPLKVGTGNEKKKKPDLWSS